jgi:hypothetical protein
LPVNRSHQRNRVRVLRSLHRLFALLQISANCIVQKPDLAIRRIIISNLGLQNASNWNRFFRFNHFARSPSCSRISKWMNHRSMVAGAEVTNRRQMGEFSTSMIQQLVWWRLSVFLGLGHCSFHLRFPEPESRSFSMRRCCDPKQHPIAIKSAPRSSNPSRNAACKHIHATVRFQRPLSRCC